MKSTLHAIPLNSDDFATALLQASILSTHESPSGIQTHTAIYRCKDVFLIPEPNDAGGTIIMPAESGEVGQHDMARDAIMRGLIDPPRQQAQRRAESSQVHAGYLDLADVPQDAVDALGRVHYVSCDVWADELKRTRIIQTDHPAGHAIAHTGMRDDGLPVVLVQAGDLFVIVLPTETP